LKKFAGGVGGIGVWDGTQKSPSKAPVGGRLADEVTQKLKLVTSVKVYFDHILQLFVLDRGGFNHGPITDFLVFSGG